MKIEHVNGKEAGKIMLYALSTCGWCLKTRQLLDNLGVAYDYIYVDLVTGKEQEEVINAMKKWNPATSFPTIVFDDKKCIIGFNQDEISKSLK